MLGWKVDHTSTASDALTCALQQCSSSSSTSKQCFRLPCNDLWKRKFRSGFRTFSASRREQFFPSEAHAHTIETHLLRQMLLHYWARARARRVSGWPPSCRSTLHAKHIYLVMNQIFSSSRRTNLPARKFAPASREYSRADLLVDQEEA